MAKLIVLFHPDCKVSRHGMGMAGETYYAMLGDSLTGVRADQVEIVVDSLEMLAETLADSRWNDHIKAAASRMHAYRSLVFKVRPSDSSQAPRYVGSGAG